MKNITIVCLRCQTPIQSSQTTSSEILFEADDSSTSFPSGSHVGNTGSATFQHNAGEYKSDIPQDTILPADGLIDYNEDIVNYNGPLYDIADETETSVKEWMNQQQTEEITDIPLVGGTLYICNYITHNVFFSKRSWYDLVTKTCETVT